MEDRNTATTGRGTKGSSTGLPIFRVLCLGQGLSFPRSLGTFPSFLLFAGSPRRSSKKVGGSRKFSVFTAEKVLQFRGIVPLPHPGEDLLFEPLPVAGARPVALCLPNPLPPDGERRKQIAGRYVGGKADRHTPQDGPSMDRDPLEEV